MSVRRPWFSPNEAFMSRTICLFRDKLNELTEHAEDEQAGAKYEGRTLSAVYAGGVADALSWLNGNPPTNELRLLLNIDPQEN